MQPNKTQLWDYLKDRDVAMNQNTLTEGIYFQQEFYLSDTITEYNQIIQGVVLQALGLLGGMFYLLNVAIGACVRPISKHNFMLRAIKRFYYARTKETELFETKQEEKKNEGDSKDDLEGIQKPLKKFRDIPIEQEILKHKVMRISNGL
tara:strand:- start:1056 stop:1502 length:447 start_codon:yes stop_codon:yes gene_type:complete